MRSEESRTAPSQETGLAEPRPAPPQESRLAPAVTATGRRKRRRWWLWLLLLGLLGAATYAGLQRLGYAEQLTAWQARLTQMAIEAYDTLPHRRQSGAAGGKAAEAPRASGKAADTPRAAGRGTDPAPPGGKATDQGRAADAPTSRTVPVLAVAARQGNMGVYLTGLGSVTAFQTVTVRSRVDGELIKVAFQEGQIVRQGDLLAEIDPRAFQVQLAQAEGQMAKDQAQLKNARLDLERYKVLLAQDSVAQQQLDTQIAMVNQFEGVIKSDQAQIDQARLLLSYTRITAPITGRIGLRLVDQGNMVRASDQNGLAMIMQLQPIAVLFNIPEDDLPQVLGRMRAGQQLVVEAYDRNLKKKLATGTLLTIDNQIDPNTGTIKCKAVFPNQDSTLFPNQFVNARLLVETKKDASIVPAAAVQRSPQATFVYVVKDDSTVEVRPVVPGPAEGDEVVIDSGIAPGEVVVIEGVDRLQHGMKVAARMAGEGKAGETRAGGGRAGEGRTGEGKTGDGRVKAN